MNRYVVVTTVFLAGCGGGSGESTSTLLPNAPRVISTINFDSKGNPVVIGGSGAHGPFQLQHAEGDLWVRAAQDPQFGMSYSTSLHRGGGALYATNPTNVYKLTDESAFTWAEYPLPETTGPVVGIDSSGTFYQARVPGGLSSWRIGDAAWTPMPGGETTAASATYTVEPSGRITWHENNGTIFRLENGVQTKLLDCNVPELQYCVNPPYSIVVHEASITILSCRDLWRFDVASGALTRLETPSRTGICFALQSAPDGTEYLGMGGNDSPGLESKWGWYYGGGNDWELALDDVPRGLAYYFRDGSTAFAGANGGAYNGIWRYEY